MRPNYRLFWIVLVAFLLRLAYIVYFQTYELPPVAAVRFGPMLDHFSFGYETGAIARSLATGHGFSSPFTGNTGPTAWIGPIYPALCAVVFKISGIYAYRSVFIIFVLNSLFAALTCLPIYKIGERTLGRGVGEASAWIFAGGVTFMRWPATWIWECSLSGLLLAVLFLQTLKQGEIAGQDSTPDLPESSVAGARPPQKPRSGNWRSAIRYGLLWGFAVLTNPALLAFLPFALAWIAWQRRELGMEMVLRRAAIVLVFFGMAISPWMVRNRVVFGKWVFIRDNAGFEFALGNYHGSNGMGWLGRHPTGNVRVYNEYVSMGETAFVQKYTREGLQFVRQYPAEFLQLVGTRFWAFWYGTYIEYAGPGLEPFPTWTYWPLSLLAGLSVITLVVRRHPAAWLYAAVMFAYPLSYELTYAHPRYRHALEPLLVIVAVHFLLGAIRDLSASAHKLFARSHALPDWKAELAR